MTILLKKSKSSLKYTKQRNYLLQIWPHRQVSILPFTLGRAGYKGSRVRTQENPSFWSNGSPDPGIISVDSAWCCLMSTANSSSITDDTSILNGCVIVRNTALFLDLLPKYAQIACILSLALVEHGRLGGEVCDPPPQKRNFFSVFSMLYKSNLSEGTYRVNCCYPDFPKGNSTCKKSHTARPGHLARFCRRESRF